MKNRNFLVKLFDFERSKIEPFLSVSRDIGFSGQIKVAFLLFIITLVVSYSLQQTGLEWWSGNKASGEHNTWAANTGTLIFSLLTTVPIAVLIEEFFFRFLAYKLLVFGKNDFWVIGIISSALFAWIHGFVGASSSYGFPTPQLILGLYLWRYIPSGFRTVFWIHIFYNLFAVALVQFLVFSKIG